MQGLVTKSNSSNISTKTNITTLNGEADIKIHFLLSQTLKRFYKNENNAIPLAHFLNLGIAFLGGMFG